MLATTASRKALINFGAAPGAHGNYGDSAFNWQKRPASLKRYSANAEIPKLSSETGSEDRNN
jgi:hypothetical protein